MIRFCFFLFPLLALAQTENRGARTEAVLAIFERGLINNFIHPQQLDATNRKLCQQYIAHVVNRFDADVVQVRFEKGFKQSEATNVFFPVFLFADSTEIAMPHFRIMQ